MPLIPIYHISKVFPRYPELSPSPAISSSLAKIMQLLAKHGGGSITGRYSRSDWETLALSS